MQQKRFLINPIHILHSSVSIRETSMERFFGSFVPTTREVGVGYFSWFFWLSF